jgi:hypothetical protein
MINLNNQYIEASKTKESIVRENIKKTKRSIIEDRYRYSSPELIKRYIKKLNTLPGVKIEVGPSRRIYYNKGQVFHCTLQYINNIRNYNK